MSAGLRTLWVLTMRAAPHRLAPLTAPQPLLAFTDKELADQAVALLRGVRLAQFVLVPVPLVETLEETGYEAAAGGAAARALTLGKILGQLIDKEEQP